MTLNAYLTFRGNCEEAFTFYQKVLGGEIVAMYRHGDTPAKDHTPAEWQDKIIHARLVVDGQVLMGSDAPPQYQTEPQGFSVSINVDEPNEAERIFHALEEGGTVKMPIGETFWALRFGMLIDRFGTPWMVNCEKAG